MATEVIQFREDAAEVQFLRSRGINPNEFARQTFEEGLRLIHSQDKFEKLSKLKVRLPRPAAEIIRDERGAH